MIERSKTGLQRRRPRPNGFTRKKREAFLDMLAVTCNVAESARAARIHPDTARNARRADPAFALLWTAATELGAARLKDEVLAFSLGQLSSDENPGDERAEPPGVMFDPDRALKTLQAIAAVERRERPGRSARLDYATDAEVNAELLKRLDALAERLSPA